MKIYKGVNYEEKDSDYQKDIDDAVAKGDYVTAAIREVQRNAKIDGEGLDYEKTYKYSDYLPGSNGIDADTKKDDDGELWKYSTKRDGKKDSFVYEPDEDTTYHDLVSAVKDNAKFVANNTLGEFASMTGGIPSSYAVSAAAGAQADVLDDIYDIYADREQNAYNRFITERAYDDEKEQEDYNRMLLERERLDQQKAAEDAAKQQAFENDITLRELGIREGESAADIAYTQAQTAGLNIDNYYAPYVNEAELEGLQLDNEGKHIDNYYAPSMYGAELAQSASDTAYTDAQTAGQWLENAGYVPGEDEDEDDVVDAGSGGYDINDILSLVGAGNSAVTSEMLELIETEQSKGIYALKNGKMPTDSEIKALMLDGYTREDINGAIKDGNITTMTPSGTPVMLDTTYAPKPGETGDDYAKRLKTLFDPDTPDETLAQVYDYYSEIVGL